MKINLRDIQTPFCETRLCALVNFRCIWIDQKQSWGQKGHLALFQTIGPTRAALELNRRALQLNLGSRGALLTTRSTLGFTRRPIRAALKLTRWAFGLTTKSMGWPLGKLYLQELCLGWPGGHVDQLGVMRDTWPDGYYSWLEGHFEWAEGLLALWKSW